MPLVRYEIRNEYSLANPDLYRAAAKDDPEGLLEGVAMAGLVGIVRQLGDLAEFAAEVFHDLHEEILATAARGHELGMRVQQLESELPFIEKMMLSETKSNHDNFIYSQGIVWHSSVRNNQNHFTQGDLPHFIRNAYEECREPPRLFLLDKFDVAGAGACLKRYTDPFFFKMEWASTELMKAEKEQQERRARRIKKKRQAVDISSRTSEIVAMKASEDGSRMLKDVYTSPVMERQAVDISSRTSENVGLRASEDGSRMLKDVYTSPVMEKQAVDISSRTSENVGLRASEDGSRMLKDIYTGPIMERQNMDISSRTSENVDLTSEDGSKMIKDDYTDPIMARKAVDISSRTAENVALRISEDGSEMLKEQSYTASVMQRQAVDISPKTSENVNLLTSEDGTRMLKEGFTVPAIHRQAVDISSSKSENVALRTSGDGSRMLKDAHTAPAMQRQGADINSKEAENVTFKVAEDALRMSENGDSVMFNKDSILRESVDSKFTTAQPAALSIAENAALLMPEKSITRMSADNILRISEDNVLRMSEDAILRMSEDTVQRMSEGPVLNLSEDSVRSMGEDAAPRISEGPTLRTSDDDVLRAIEITDDFASETENFVDALTTMDSEVETDTETKVKFEDDEGDYFVTSDKISSKNLAKTDSKNIMMDEENLYNDCKKEEQVIIGISSVVMNDRSHAVNVEEHTANVEEHTANDEFSHDLSERDFPHEDYAEEERGKMHIPDKESTVERIDLVQQVSRLNIDGDVQSTMERIDPVQQVSRLNIDGDLQRTMESIDVVQHVSRPNIDGDAHYKLSDSAIEKEQEEKVEESPRHINASIDTYSLLGRNNGILKTADHYESESIENIPETPETSEADDGESVEMENLSELPVSTCAPGDESRGKFPKWRRSHSSDRQLQSTNEGFYKGLSASDLSSEDSESELSDSLKGTSPRSSPDSSIRPIKWVTKSHDRTSGSDDDMDGMQVSSASSSTLSSPRPSTLATTVFSVDLKISTPSPDRLMEPSLVSHLSESPKPVANTASPVSTRAISPDICAGQFTEVLESPLSESFIGPPAEPLESPNSTVLKFRAAEPLIFTPDEALGSAVETFQYPSEDSRFPSLEPLKFLTDPLITDPSRSSAAHLSQPVALDYNLSLQSGFPIQQKYATSSSFVDVEPEQFPPPPPLPPRQWLMSKRLQKTISPTFKEEESHLVSAPGNVSTVSNMQLKDFHPLAKESPASKILQSPEWPVDTLELQYAPVMIGEESPHVARGSLDLQKLPVSSEVFEPSKIGIFQARHENSPLFQDSPFHVNNLVSSQVIKTSSTNSRSCESLSTRSHMHMETLKPSGTTKEESSVEENDIVQSVFPPSSQDFVSSSTGLVNHKIVMKRDEQLESCSNLRQLSSEGFLDRVDHLQDFDASNTSHHDSQKLPIMPKETLESFELPPMKFTVDISSPSVNGKRDAVDVSTADFSSGKIQNYPILGDIENVNECSLSHSSIQGSRYFVDSPSSSSVCKGTISPGSKDDDHMPATVLDGLQSVGTYSPVSGDTVEIMSSPEQFDNSKTILPARLQKKDPLIEAIASHDRSTLKKVPELSQSSRTAPSDERGVLLEQIRNRSFSLRQIKVEKQAVPQPVTNINVAAILEKANAIRQAFAGSDDEDDWSDG